MKVYPVYMHDHSSEDAIEVFTNEDAALDYIKNDIKCVRDILREDGYYFIEEVHQEGYFAVYAADRNIFYEWTLFETILRT